MNDLMEEAIFNSVTCKNGSRKSGLIKAEDVQISGSSKFVLKKITQKELKLFLPKMLKTISKK